MRSISSMISTLSPSSSCDRNFNLIATPEAQKYPTCHYYSCDRASVLDMTDINVFEKENIEKIEGNTKKFQQQEKEKEKEKIKQENEKKYGYGHGYRLGYDPCDLYCIHWNSSSQHFYPRFHSNVNNISTNTSTMKCDRLININSSKSQHWATTSISTSTLYKQDKEEECCKDNIWINRDNSDFCLKKVVLDMENGMAIIVKKFDASLDYRDNAPNIIRRLRQGFIRYMNWRQESESHKHHNHNHNHNHKQQKHHNNNMHNNNKHWNSYSYINGNSNNCNYNCSYNHNYDDRDDCDDNFDYINSNKNKNNKHNSKNTFDYGVNLIDRRKSLNKFEYVGYLSVYLDIDLDYLLNKIENAIKNAFKFGQLYPNSVLTQAFIDESLNKIHYELILLAEIEYNNKYFKFGVPINIIHKRHNKAYYAAQNILTPYMCVNNVRLNCQNGLIPNNSWVAKKYIECDYNSYYKQFDEKWYIKVQNAHI